MRVEIRNNSVLIDGYVNAVERQSRPVLTQYGKVIEVIEERAFDKALSRAKNVDLLLNHDKTRNLGSTTQGNLELFEDNIGLRAIATVTDEHVIEEARAGKLSGWSFGMSVNDDTLEQRADMLPLRKVKDLDLFEVSIIDSRMTPCYTATSIEARAEGDCVVEQRASESKVVVEVIEKEQPIDYSKYENSITKTKSAN